MKDLAKASLAWGSVIAFVWFGCGSEQQSPVKSKVLSRSYQPSSVSTTWVSDGKSSGHFVTTHHGSRWIVVVQTEAGDVLPLDCNETRWAECAEGSDTFVTPYLRSFYCLSWTTFNL